MALPPLTPVSTKQTLKLASTVSRPSGVIGSGAIPDARRVERPRSSTRTGTPRGARCSPSFSARFSGLRATNLGPVYGAGVSLVYDPTRYGLWPGMSLEGLAWRSSHCPRVPCAEVLAVGHQGHGRLPTGLAPVPDVERIFLQAVQLSPCLVAAVQSSLDVPARTRCPNEFCSAKPHMTRSYKTGEIMSAPPPRLPEEELDPSAGLGSRQLAYSLMETPLSSSRSDALLQQLGRLVIHTLRDPWLWSASRTPPKTRSEVRLRLRRTEPDWRRWSSAGDE